jgi:DNA-binding winged helix-turn-helix (wHTH) protein
MREAEQGRVAPAGEADNERRVWARVEIDRERGRLAIDDWLLRLSPALLELLYLLASRGNANVPLAEIRERALDVRGGQERSIRDRIYQQIRRLRRLLPDGLRIIEEPRKGYRLVRSSRRSSSRVGGFRS